jgi:hypothetical protein
MKNYFIIVGLSILFFACEKQEIPVSAPVPGDVIVKQVEMGSDYALKLFFSLKNNEVVSQLPKIIYDLSFESSDEGWNVLINSGKIMKVAFYEGADFPDVLNTNEANWKWDSWTGNMDSTAIGDWRSANGIYLIDRGYNELGEFQGFSKLKIDSVDVNNFYIRSSDLNGDNILNSIIPKIKRLSFTPFSLDQGHEFVSTLWPDKEDWDIVFTSYTYVYYDLEEITPYQVTGVLINPHNVRAIREDSVLFEDIDLEYASEISLINKLDVIGFDWKFYNFDEGFYSVLSDQSYIIQDVEGVFYKLRFVDFYDDSGVKGAPKFEFQKL